MKLGSKVYVEDLDLIGTVTEIDDTGKPLKVISAAGDVIEVINMTVSVLTALKKLWLFIRDWL